MRVKVLTIEADAGAEGVFHEHMVVEKSVTPAQADAWLEEDAEANILCLCFDQETATKIADAWNAMYSQKH